MLVNENSIFFHKNSTFAVCCSRRRAAPSYEPLRRFAKHSDTLMAITCLDGTALDERIIKVGIDPGFKQGRQYGRGMSGGQVPIFVCICFEGHHDSGSEETKQHRKSAQFYRGCSVRLLSQWRLGLGPSFQCLVGP